MDSTGKKLAERPHWHMHSINHRKDGGRRKWIHRSWHVYREHDVASAELAVPGGFSLRLVLNDDNPIEGNIGLGLFTLYWHLGWWARSLPLCQWMARRYRYDAREIEVYWNGEAVALFWSLWMRPHEWRRGEAKWRRGSFHPVDLLFGKQRYHKNILTEATPITITIPGDPAPYPATVALEHPVWTRSRWPWWPLRREHYTADIEIPAGIPIPGKGENSWDIDDDAVYGMSTPATTIDEAVAAVVASVERDRKRHGWPGWTPRRKLPSEG